MIAGLAAAGLLVDHLSHWRWRFNVIIVVDVDDEIPIAMVVTKVYVAVHLIGLHGVVGY